MGCSTCPLPLARFGGTLADGETRNPGACLDDVLELSDGAGITDEDLAGAQGEQDAAIALADEDRGGRSPAAGCSPPTSYLRPPTSYLGVGPSAYRRAYLDAAATVLGHKPLIVA